MELLGDDGGAGGAGWQDVGFGQSHGNTSCNTTQLDEGSIRLVVRFIGGGMAVVSVLSASIIFVTFARWQDMRTVARRLLLFITLADFLTAVGNFLGVVLDLDQVATGTASHVNLSLFEVYHPKGCEVQSFVTTMSSLMSFFWTCILAWYLYLSLVHLRPDFFVRPCHRVTMHLIGWGLPIALATAALGRGALGADRSTSASAGWCFIRGTDKRDFSQRDKLIWQLIAGKMWEILTYLIVIVLYARIKYFISKNAEHQTFVTAGAVKAIREADKKFTLVPLIFILIRLPGTIRFFISAIKPHCASHSLEQADRIFLILQSAGDSSQAFANFILFVCLTKKIRRRLRRSVTDCLCCWRGSGARGRGRDRVADGDDERRPILRFTASGRHVVPGKASKASAASRIGQQRVHDAGTPPLGGGAFSARPSIGSASPASIPKDFLSVGGGVFVDPKPASDGDNDDDTSTDEEGVAAAWTVNSIQS